MHFYVHRVRCGSYAVKMNGLKANHGKHDLIIRLCQAAYAEDTLQIACGVEFRTINEGDINIGQAFSRFGINHFSGNGPLTGKTGGKQEKACAKKEYASY